MTIDFVISNPNHHMAMFRPLLEWLSERGGYRLRVLSFCELRGLSTPYEEIQQSGAEACRCVSIRLSKSSPPTRVAREKIGGRSREWLRSILWYGFTNWSGLYKHTRPALVILPNDSSYPYHRIADRLHDYGIPFLLVQEGIRFEQPDQLPGRQYGQGNPTAVAAWGPCSGRYFQRVGVPPQRIHMIGNPRLDEIGDRDWNEAAQQMRVELDLGPNMLLYVSNPVDQQGLCSTQEKYKLFVDFLRSSRAFLKETSHQLVVKIHTGESLYDFKNLIDQEIDGGRVILVHDKPLYPLIHMSGAVVILASTAGLEAMLMDRPVGVLPTPRKGYVYDYVESRAAVGLETNGRLSEQLRLLVADHPDIKRCRRAYVQDQVVNYGCATKALGELILQLAETQQKLMLSRGSSRLLKDEELQSECPST